MAGPTVHLDAARKDRSLVNAADSGRRRVVVDPQLLFWRKLIDLAVADAKRTAHGLPTYSALQARWWIEEHKPVQKDRDEWERSFECACNWLNLDATAERSRLVTLIEKSVMDAYVAYVRAATYQMRAAMLACAGVSTAIAKQFVLPLVSEADYEQVAGIEHGDPKNVTLWMESRAA